MNPEILNRLKLSLQGLAAPAERQLLIFPEGVCKVDELALDFGQWCDGALLQSAELTSSQRSLLGELSARLGRMSVSFR